MTLLFVPIAITWPRLAPLWFFGYVAWMIGVLAPKPHVSDPPPTPPNVPEQAWLWSHTEPLLSYPLGVSLTIAAVAAGVAVARRRAPETEPGRTVSAS